MVTTGSGSSVAPGRLVVPVLHVKIHQVVAVPAVDGQDDQDEEVDDEDEVSQRESLREQRRSESVSQYYGRAP